MRIFIFSLMMITFFAYSEVVDMSIPNGLSKILPNSWNITETSGTRHPYGLTKGEEKHLGLYLELSGEKSVNFHWLKNGSWNDSPFAVESLELWVMPSEYTEGIFSWFDFKGSKKAKIVYSNDCIKVYAFLTHKVVNKEAFTVAVNGAESSYWSNSPHQQNSVSWTGWEKDLARLFDSNNYCITNQQP